jgi:hypothetical protein
MIYCALGKAFLGLLFYLKTNTVSFLLQPDTVMKNLVPETEAMLTYGRLRVRRYLEKTARSQLHSCIGLHYLCASYKSGSGTYPCPALGNVPALQ